MIKRTRFWALVLCVSLCFSILSGCKNENENEKASYKGTHDYTALETDGDFIKNGKTDYIIVIPEDCSNLLYTARDELTYFFEKATDIKLKSTTEDLVEQYANSKYISIGETELLEKSGLTIDKSKLGADGHNIFTGDDQNVYLVGGSDYGSLYAVYTFLTLNFNFESYYADCYEIDTGVRNLKLKDFQVTDIPDFKERGLGYGIYANDATYDIKNFRYRMRMAKQRGANLMPIFSEFNNPSSPSGVSTNADKYLPYDTYNNLEKNPDTYHPNWFSNRCTAGIYQFCFTARGDETEYQLMVEEVAKKIENSLVIFPRATYGDKYTAVSMTTQDNHNICTCDACLKDEAKYGYGGMVARFINDVGVLVEEWMEKPENEPYKRDNFRIIFFAYLEYSEPPISYDEKTDTWTPVDDTVRLRDNVGVYLAPARNFAWERSVYDPENDKGRKVVEGWAELTDCIYLWTYSTNFEAFMYISDNYSMFNHEGYQYFCEKNVEMIVNQGQSNNPYSTAWHCLKMYLDSKLQWNCNLDTQTLTNNWFKAMFGDAANAMQALFTEQLTYAHKTYIDAGFCLPGSGPADAGVKSVNYWPLGLLETWVNKFDEAKKLLNVNHPKYQMYVDHIEWEAMSPVYIALSLHGQQNSKMSTATRTAYRARLAADISYFGIANMLATEKGDKIGDVLL